MITTLVAFTIVISLLVAYLTYRSDAILLAKMVTLPLIIAASGFAVYYIYAHRGEPVDVLPEKFTYIHHEVEVVNDIEMIVLWGIVDDVNRLYTFPYDREAAKKLEEAKKGRENGEAIEGTFTVPKGGDAAPIIGIESVQLPDSETYTK